MVEFNSYVMIQLSKSLYIEAKKLKEIAANAIDEKMKYILNKRANRVMDRSNRLLATN